MSNLMVESMYLLIACLKRLLEASPLGWQEFYRVDQIKEWDPLDQELRLLSKGILVTAAGQPMG